jgi:integrase
MPRPASIRWHAHAAAWRADVGPVGKAGRRSPVYWRFPQTAAGRAQAVQALAAYLADRGRAEAEAERAATAPRVWEVVEDYLEHSQSTVAARTFAGHAERLATWESTAPGAVADVRGVPRDVRPAHTLTARDLRRVIQHWEKAGYSPRYIANLIGSIKACWAWAASAAAERKPGQPERLIPADPFREVKGPKLPRAPERYVSPDQAERLLSWIDARAQDAPGITGEFVRLTALLFRALYATGARPGELCRATWADFLPDPGVIVLDAHKTADATGRPRVVPLTAELVRRLMAARDRPGRHPTHIFTHRRGEVRPGTGPDAARAGEPWEVGPLGQTFRKLRMQAEAAGIDVQVRDGLGRVVRRNPGCTLYDFRRSYATDGTAAGGADRTAAVLGHSVAMTERTYSADLARGLVEAAEAVAERRRGGG